MGFCCDKFAQEASKYNTPVANGALYPGQLPDGQFELDEDGAWHINGCCGGGCYVLVDMKFCPFCGTAVT